MRSGSVIVHCTEIRLSTGKVIWFGCDTSPILASSQNCSQHIYISLNLQKLMHAVRRIMNINDTLIRNWYWGLNAGAIEYLPFHYLVVETASSNRTIKFKHIMKLLLGCHDDWRHFCMAKTSWIVFYGQLFTSKAACLHKMGGFSVRPKKLQL